MNTIEVVIKSNYGVESVYVKDVALARTISSLTGTKTLQKHHIQSLKALGFTIVEIKSERMF